MSPCRRHFGSAYLSLIIMCPRSRSIKLRPVYGRQYAKCIGAKMPLGSSSRKSRSSMPCHRFDWPIWCLPCHGKTRQPSWTRRSRIGWSRACLTTVSNFSSDSPFRLMRKLFLCLADNMARSRLRRLPWNKFCRGTKAGWTTGLRLKRSGFYRKWSTATCATQTDWI